MGFSTDDEKNDAVRVLITIPPYACCLSETKITFSDFVCMKVKSLSSYVMSDFFPDVQLQGV